jgi:hypothetical protein
MDAIMIKDKYERIALFEISKALKLEDVEKYEQIVIEIKSPSSFTIIGKKRDGLFDVLRNCGLPVF